MDRVAVLHKKSIFQNFRALSPSALQMEANTRHGRCATAAHDTFCCGPEYTRWLITGVLANFQANPENAGPSLKSCLDFAAQNIPGAKINATRIRLGATAGMRLLQ